MAVSCRLTSIVPADVSAQQSRRTCDDGSPRPARRFRCARDPRRGSFHDHQEAACGCLRRFKSDDLSGPAKAAWILLIVLVPLLGVLCYVVARGDKMEEHEAAA
jgi:Phospholipase_D-nuclease N-terminal